MLTKISYKVALVDLLYLYVSMHGIMQVTFVRMHGIAHQLLKSKRVVPKVNKSGSCN